jgi:tetratricopeptide (TPR) repeat protein
MSEPRGTHHSGSHSRKLARRKTARGTQSTLDLLQAAQVHVGNFLRTTRESLNLTQAEVATRTRESPWQLSRAAVSAIERGQNFPGLEAMLALSNVLHIDPKELIERARMAAVVPVDVSGLRDQELDQRASQYFWAGDFKQALAVYDALAQKLALEEPAEDQLVARLASLEVRRATTLKRIGALISAIASAERAISLATRLPAIQAEAYVVLADLQGLRGHLPLARDAAERAIEIAKRHSDKSLTWAYMVKGRVLFLSKEYSEALVAFEEARAQAMASGDRQHLTHIEGNIGGCLLAQGQLAEGRAALDKAVDLARANGQRALEASWLVELGGAALNEGRLEDADRLALEALEIANGLDHRVTQFRAEWLRHRVVQRLRPEDPDTERLGVLRTLFEQVGTHQGIVGIAEYRDTMLRPSPEAGAES